MEFDELPEFKKDLKQLLKKYRTLRDDLEVLKKVLGAECAQHPQLPISFRIPGLGVESPAIIKVKKFASKSLKGKRAQSGFRIIYAYYKDRGLIQFVELYFKADQDNEDRGRIQRHFCPPS